VRAAHRWLGWITAFLAGSILAGMVILVFLTVIYRYCLLAPISWGEEMARFLFIAVSMLGAALAMKDRSHFAITILTVKFPPAVQARIEILVALGATALLGVVIDKGWGLALLNRNQISPALGVPMSLAYLPVPLGAALMLLFLWTDLLVKRHETARPGTGATHTQMVD
jgi:TRAP-type C4-dicarboxylate transport system permease small subunit